MNVHVIAARGVLVKACELLRLSAMYPNIDTPDCYKRLVYIAIDCIKRQGLTEVEARRVCKYYVAWLMWKS